MNIFEIGEYSKLKKMVTKKIEKGLSAEEIAELFEEDLDEIKTIIEEIHNSKDKE